MRRILPHPILSGGLFLIWLLLNQTAAPGPALVGLVLAVMGGLMLSALEPEPIVVRRVGTVLRLAGHVLADVARSNVAVARIVLRRERPRSGFIRIQLGLRNPTALAALACILTATPGSAWVEFDPAEGWLLLHVLDLTDEESWVRLIQDRYEQPLMEIFP